MAESILDYACELGIPTPSHSRGQLVDYLKPKPAESSPWFSLSGKYGLGAFPFHTDSAHRRVPPRYVLLRSVGETNHVRPTLVLDSYTLRREVADEAALTRDVWIVNGGRGAFLTTLLNENLRPPNKIFRYDPVCMRPAHDRFTASVRVIEKANQKITSSSVQWNTGLLIIIDNWRMLHARSDAGDYNDEHRVLERCLIADAI